MPTHESKLGHPTPAVVAWEGPAGAPVDHQLEAIAALGEHLRHVVAAIAIPDSLLTGAPSQVANLLGRYGLRALPFFNLRTHDAASKRQQSPLADALAVLGDAGLLYADEGMRYAIAAVDDNRPDPGAIGDVRAALTSSRGHARIGWVRRTSAFGMRPPALDFVLDHPPYGNAPPGADTAKHYPYPILVSELARRYAGDDPVMPSVLWATGSETRLADSEWIVSEISPLKAAYAIDIARRFVLNRVAQGTPLWMLRTSFDPRRPDDLRSLDALAELLCLPHIPSATPRRIADLPDAPASGARIAVLLHLYYPDLWDEMAGAIARLPENFDLFVSCPYRVASAMRVLVRRQFPRAIVFGVHNLGRDVLPFLLWLRAPGAKAYTYVLKLHGKKSVHIVDTAEAPFGGGEEWRRWALEELIGSHTHARALLRVLDDRPEVGLVAPNGQLYDQVTWKCGTADLVATALARLGLPNTVSGKFPAGTMFWARLSALAPLADVPDAALDFEREAGQVDGTLHHAYERMMALVAAHAGFQTTDSGTLLSAQARR